jgi:transposase-like protein
MISDIIKSKMIAEILEGLIQGGTENFAPVLEKLLNELMKIEREKCIGAQPFERTEDRKGYSNGFKDKTLQTRTGPLRLKIPQVRDLEFYPACLEKGCRSEKALKIAIAEMYVQGVSTRRVKKITEELCGFEISSTQVSRLASLLDEDLKDFRQRVLGKIKYIYVDARYEKVRQAGNVRDLAVLSAIGVNNKGKREVLGISVSLSEAEIHWRDFFEDLQKRGMSGLELIISDDHSGLGSARKSVFPSVPWQRCTFHMAQNAQGYAPKQEMKEEIGQVMRDIFNCPNLKLAQECKRMAVEKYVKAAPKFAEWLENNVEEGLTFFQFPQEHRKKIRTSNAMERLNQEIKRRTRVVRVFSNEESCERLVTAILQEIHEEWVSGKIYLKVE